MATESKSQQSEPTYVVLTPWAISSFPKMLAVQIPDYKLILPLRYITPQSLDLLSFTKKGDTLAQLLLSAEKAGIIELRDVEAETNWWSDVVLTLAHTISNEKRKVLIVGTVSETLALQAQIDRLSITRSLEVLDVEAFRKLLNTSTAVVSSELLELASQYQKEKGYVELKNSWRLLPPLAFLILTLTQPGNVLGVLNRVGVYKVSVWITIVAVAIFAVMLFWYRAKHRLFYGVLETSFGITVASKVLYSNLDLSRLVTIDYIQLVSGVYIVIRGLDNVEKGITYTDSEALKDLWARLFGPPNQRI